ncbi:glycine zipper 2TM domain-containing protein [Sphingomonas gilva]|uniref:17 kDa surface antigen n=1 Tax=Sphingomonas gilva TaxID=2305907 RepID=A0A396RQX8_9SPHN|nr:glycine zipper 2TM domain-containing protein [Sphingomonas gilva]RHW19047.1 glycine zipper 2TM domain-containing protein [Sphingomonas gilva]
MRIPVSVLALAAAIPLSACASMYGDDGYGYGGDGYFGQEGYAERTYRQGDYRARPLRDDDMIYRGRDGRYYCRRDDGSTGLVVGGIAGGVLGNIIAPGGSKLLGTILGAGAGALAGREIDRNDARCQ